MSYKEFMNKVRYWDNMTAKWLMRHFYFMFFQIILVAIFVFWFATTIGIIDSHYQVAEENLVERFLSTLTINTTIIALLLLLNSFWMLYIFNSMQRISSLLKDVTYNTSKLRFKDK